MIKRFIALFALAISAAAVAHADPISGFFSATGTDIFTTSSITFDSAQVAGAIGGNFATYLTDGNPIIFAPGPLPYSNGMNTAPPNTTLFTTTENGETFTFIITDYMAQYINNGTNGCTSGSTCLIVTGDGLFTGSGPLNGTSGTASLQLYLSVRRQSAVGAAYIVLGLELGGCHPLFLNQHRSPSLAPVSRSCRVGTSQVCIIQCVTS